MRKIKCLNSDWCPTTGAAVDNYQYYYASDNSSTDNTGDWTPTTDKNLENYDPFPQTVYTLPDPNAGPLEFPDYFGDIDFDLDVDIYNSLVCSLIG